jgi:hypothetical protein
MPRRAFAEQQGFRANMPKRRGSKRRWAKRTYGRENHVEITGTCIARRNRSELSLNHSGKDMAMPIEPISGPNAVASNTRLRRRRQPGFAIPDTGEAEPAHAPAEASAVLAPVLTQQADDMAEAAAAADREAAQLGHGLLGAMKGLQLAMLGGTGDDGQAVLSKLAAGLPHATDPALNDVLRAIAQRAAVERARRA